LNGTIRFVYTLLARNLGMSRFSVFARKKRGCCAERKKDGDEAAIAKEVMGAGPGEFQRAR